MHSEGVAPTSDTFNTIIRAFGHHCYYDEALVFYEEMMRMEISPNGSTFRYLLRVRASSPIRTLRHAETL